MDTQKETHNNDVVPPTASAYLDPKYWDERFAREEHYEWFKEYSHFRHLILQHIKPNSSVLELGCGNSKLCEELYTDGINQLTCIDLSPIAVDKMKNRLLSKGYKVCYSAFGIQKGIPSNCVMPKRSLPPMTEIKVLEADMLDLPFPDECFDVVIEKGTMDILFVDSGDPWNPKPTTVNKVMTMLQEAHRVLKPHGVFVSITFGQPHFRRPLFTVPKFNWSMEWRTFGDAFHYFFYILKKGERSPESITSDEKLELQSISPYHEELENEDYIFRTNIEEIWK